MKHSPSVILPGAWLGVLGGGQLGAMFLVEARRMGYKIAVLDPDSHSPAGKMADKHLQAKFDDKQALEKLSTLCEAVTTEFENVPAATLKYLESKVKVAPSSQAVSIAQNRITEKHFMQQHGLDVVPFAVLEQVSDRQVALDNIEGPAILKLATMGYDGKGQILLPKVDAESLQQAWDTLGNASCILEKCITLKQEVSIVLARNSEGETVLYAPGENYHKNGILDYTLVPANLSISLQKRIQVMARKLAENLEYCGVLTIEFFIDHNDNIFINEIAPRPHNSGHHTLDACVTSQFEQQLRMLCGLPAGSPALQGSVIMQNLLGDLWQDGEPDWQSLFQESNLQLHLYGKNEARQGRKMGHFCLLGVDSEKNSKENLLMQRKRLYSMLARQSK